MHGTINLKFIMDLHLQKYNYPTTIRYSLLRRISK